LGTPSWKQPVTNDKLDQANIVDNSEREHLGSRPGAAGATFRDGRWRHEYKNSFD
jgi:hypothetical protein